MKIIKVLTTVAVIVSFTVTTVFAAAGNSNDAGRCPNSDCRQRYEEFQKDPIKALQNRKEEIQSLLKDGKISKEKAEEITTRIDAKIKRIEEFNKLTLEQKRAKLIKNCSTRLDRLVKEGKLEQAKADEILKQYTDEITNWDGTGYPGFHARMYFDKCKKNEKQE
jgi:tRNA A37 N6-isopentenylltransferase MiaA